MYRTQGQLTLMGRAIVMRLDDCVPALPSTLEDPHMTILFRKEGYNATDLQQLQLYLKTHFPKRPFTFRLGPYTQGFVNSAGIYGELRRVCLLLRAGFDTLHAQPRPPHVKLR